MADRKQRKGNGGRDQGKLHLPRPCPLVIMSSN
jgi:hypothetical protein